MATKLVKNLVPGDQLRTMDAGPVTVTSLEKSALFEGPALQINFTNNTNGETGHYVANPEDVVALAE